MPIGTKKADKTLLDTIKRNFDKAKKADEDNITRCVASTQFIDFSEQWDVEVLAKRNEKKVPSLTLNITKPIITRVVMDIIANMPQLAVRGEDPTDTLKATKMHAILKHVERVNKAKRIYDNCATAAMTGGFSYCRIWSDYSDYDTFDQEIKMEYIRNQATVLLDPASKRDDFSDIKWGLIYSDMEGQNVVDEYGKDALVGFDDNAIGSGNEGWYAEDRVRVVEYYWKKPTDRTLLHVRDKDGKTAVFVKEDIDLDDLLANQYTIIEERTRKHHKVFWCKASGTKILEQPREVPCDFIPIIKFVALESNDEGKREFFSFADNFMTAQRVLNYAITAEIVNVSAQPKAAWKGTPIMFKGFEDDYRKGWEDGSKMIRYNPDPMYPGIAPVLERPPVSSQGFLNLISFAQSAAKDTSGISDSYLGQKSNEISGRAINMRQSASSSSVGRYADNILEGVLYTGQVMLNMILKMYNTPGKVVRVLGEDGLIEMMRLSNVIVDPKTLKVTIPEDVSKNKYDYVVDASSTSKLAREDQLKLILQALNIVSANNPEVVGILLPELFRNSNLANGTQIADMLTQAQVNAAGTPAAQPQNGATEIADAQSAAVSG